jgi:hypothetical protein
VVLVVKLLRWAGAIVILAGVIAGLSIGFGWDSQAYDSAARVYAQLPDNSYSKAEYDALRPLWLLHVVGGWSVALSGALSGLVFLGLARAVEVGEEIRFEQLYPGESQSRRQASYALERDSHRLQNGT